MGGNSSKKEASGPTAEKYATYNDEPEPDIGDEMCEERNKKAKEKAKTKEAAIARQASNPHNWNKPSHHHDEHDAFEQDVDELEDIDITKDIVEERIEPKMLPKRTMFDRDFKKETENAAVFVQMAREQQQKETRPKKDETAPKQKQPELIIHEESDQSHYEVVDDMEEMIMDP